MFGMFGLLNLLAATLYPVLASYKAYDNYSRLANQAGATTVNFGGMSIPLGTMLKRAASAEHSVEEDTLNYRLLHVQMWLVYWIVHACLNFAENLLLLKYLPFYSMARLALTLWLVAPIVLSESRTNTSKVLSFQDLQQEWSVFSSSGCGMIYFNYLKPFFDKHISLIDNFKIDSVLSMVSGNIVLPLSQKFASQRLSKASDSIKRDTSNDFVSSFATYFVSSETKSDTIPVADDLVISEYDVVSKNESEMNDGVRNRQPKDGYATTDESEHDTAIDPHHVSSAKSSWFW